MQSSMYGFALSVSMLLMNSEKETKMSSVRCLDFHRIAPLANELYQNECCAETQRRLRQDIKRERDRE